MVAGIIVAEVLDITLHVTLWTVKTTVGGVYNLVKYITRSSNSTQKAKNTQEEKEVKEIPEEKEVKETPEEKEVKETHEDTGREGNKRDTGREGNKALQYR